MAQIVISRWQPEDKRHLTASLAGRFTTAAIPIAFLRLFRIGDLWSGAQQVGIDESFVQETFANLEINDNTVNIAPAGLPLDPDNTSPLFPLPFTAFEAHRDHTGAFCARVRVADDITLVVPCMELIRFYFGASGSLLRQLFSGAMAGSKLYSAAKINTSTGVARLDLAPSLPGVAASTVGRIAFDDQARRAMRWLINSGVSAAANRERHYPRTTFPFAGTTDLAAQGRWIDLHGHRVFLAERLIRCTHPFPFRTLFYTSSMNRMATRQAVRRILDRKSHTAHATGRQPAPRLAEARVARDLQPTAITIGEENDCPFPDLLTKHVRRIKNDRPSFARRAASSQEEVLGAGEPLSSSDIRPVEITTEPIELEVEESYPQGALFVQDICRELLSTGNDYVQLAPPIDSTLSIDSPFMRGTDLVPQPDTRLERIWAARLITKAPGIEPSLLLLIKEKEDWWGESSGDQAILFPYSPDADPQGQILKKRLMEFAGMARGPDPNEVVVKGEMQIGEPCGADRMLSFLTWVWSIGDIHYGGQKL